VLGPCAGIVLVALASNVAAQAVGAKDVVQQYAAIVYASYEDSLTSAKTMRRTIDAFVSQPSRAHLEAAKASWLAAREWYGQTEAFRFYSGPIDDADGPEPRINAWPVDESYIDSVKDNAGSGIVNDPKVSITKRRLMALNANGGQENIATGWHAIEFLLWGQDLNDNGPGDRSFEDFVDGKKANATRRREYLKVVTELLIDDLTYVTNAWRPDADNYRRRFVSDPMEALRRVLVGIGSLSRGEIAGERLEVPLATQDQEDEQSCFSDNTHRDIIADALGIENAWLGRYRRADGSLLQGASLNDLVAARDATVAAQTTAAVAATIAAARAIHPPFDQEIRGDSTAPGRLRVQATVDALKLQAMDFVASAGAIGITKLTIVRPSR
jgi:putative iron-regulated protein